MGYINRTITDSIIKGTQYFGVTAITGPRQSGKTTLCKHIFPDYDYVNLEQLTTRDTIQRNPIAFLTT